MEGLTGCQRRFDGTILLIGRDIFQRPRRHNAVVQCGQRQRAMNTEEPEQWNKIT